MSTVSDPDFSNLMSRNMFSTLQIDDLLRRRGDKDLTTFSATLSRLHIPPNLIDTFPHPLLRDPEHVVVRPASDLEPNGTPKLQHSQLPSFPSATLRIKLGEKIGDGMTGIVYEAIALSITHPDGSDDNVPTGYLPPLVVKVGRLNRSASMVREAWFYEDMEPIQGIAVPRCYGCFELKVPRGTIVEPCLRNCTDYDNDFEELIDFSEYPEEALLETGVEPHPTLTELIAARDRLHVTIFERLGPELAPGIDHEEEVRDDIHSLFTNISSLGVHLNSSVARENILQAPTSPPGIPSQVSPYTNRTHAWRAIGFGQAFKTPYLRWITDAEHNQELGSMFGKIPYEWCPSSDSRGSSPDGFDEDSD
ncbi:uncharacterized protein STEHIDRAFT_162045 [Stereum hirsutum FP-91666 SS1]|uniref:uncharacterized protein n=1 Tax=Stereum hirsutum (strain FP-91666) TaxID=721885 RepID=UPI0004449960|nr:uncharacterized protein STEHIDRAFT_162045 [Stereum hirsutum FP-91666 SS1]EIM81044.1 hypothetical protein STEHIDRAFT_162045 [Stereum hirsutum FP-91666 SS1]